MFHVCMDKHIGRITKKVDDSGIRKNTLSLFIDDNGTDRKVISGNNGVKIADRKGHPVVTGSCYWEEIYKTGNLINSFHVIF